MDYLNTIYSGLHKFLMLNTATLSGAVDIIVVEDVTAINNMERSQNSEEKIRSLSSTPFHIRFGKLKLLNSSQHVVDIKINKKLVDLKMKLGAEGVAYFVQTCYEDPLRKTTDHVHLASPIIAPLDSEKGLKKIRGSLSSDILMVNSSVTSNLKVNFGKELPNKVPQTESLSTDTALSTPQISQQRAVEDLPAPLELNVAQRSFSATASPALGPCDAPSQGHKQTPVDPLGDVIWWWGNPEPRRSTKVNKLHRVESVLGSWSRQNPVDSESQTQLDNLTKEIEDLDTALALSGMDVEANTTTGEEEDVCEKKGRGTGSGSSWSFLS